MTNSKKAKNLNIIYLFLLIIYGLVAIGAIAVAYHSENAFDNKKLFAGAILLMSSLPHIFIFFIKGGFKNLRVVPYFIFSLIGIVFGAVAMITKSISINAVCICWGVFDICRSLYELCDIVPQLKDKKILKGVEIIVSVLEIIIAILLIVHKEEGLRVHFKFIGFSFIVLLLNEIIILRVEKRKS